MRTRPGPRKPGRHPHKGTPHPRNRCLFSNLLPWFFPSSRVRISCAPAAPSGQVFRIIPGGSRSLPRKVRKSRGAGCAALGNTPGGGWLLAPGGLGSGPQQGRALGEGRFLRAGTLCCLVASEAWSRAPRCLFCLPGLLCLCVFCAQEGQALIPRPQAASGAFLPSWTVFPRRSVNSPAWRRWWRSNLEPAFGTITAAGRSHPPSFD